MSATVDGQMPLSVVCVNKLLPGYLLFIVVRRINLLKQERIIPFFLLINVIFFLEGSFSPFLITLLCPSFSKRLPQFYNHLQRTTLLFKSRKKDIISCLKQHHSCCVKKNKLKKGNLLNNT